MSTEKKIKTKQTNKNKKPKESKFKQLTIYVGFKLICTCKCLKWSIHLLVFIWVNSLATGKMVLDLHVARVTAYPESDGTFNVKIKLVFNITPQIEQLYIDKLNIGWLIIISLNVTCSRHDISENWRFCVKQQSLIPSKKRGCRGSDHMVNWYTISVYRHLSCEFESHSWRIALDTTICDKMCRWLAASRGFLQVLRFPSPMKLTSMIQLKYSWKWR